MSKKVTYGNDVTHNYDKVDPRGSSDSEFYKKYGANASYFQTEAEEKQNWQKKRNETPVLGKWTPEHAGTTGYFGRSIYGGKKTKRKRSRRSKKSRRHRKK